MRVNISETRKSACGGRQGVLTHSETERNGEGCVCGVRESVLEVMEQSKNSITG